MVVRGEADFAVHSLKDVPGDVPLAEGMGILSVPVREDPRDVLVTVDGTDLASLKRGAKVGTTSRRRVVQLQRQRPDLGFVPLRGNIEIRTNDSDPEGGNLTVTQITSGPSNGTAAINPRSMSIW